MNIAYIMAWQYDHTIAEDPNEWLDQFEMFDIYIVLPQIIDLWGLNTEAKATVCRASPNQQHFATAYAPAPPLSRLS